MHLLRTLGLRKSYGKTPALADLSLSVPRGSVYGFLGRNGAGKTTALRTVMGIISPDAGSVELFGELSKRRTLKERQRIGYVSQEAMFYPWMDATALGRLVAGFYPRWDRARFSRLLEVFDVPDDRPSSVLSGGTRAKLALALALAPRPELLILDEPTAGLDPVARREFLDIVVDGARGDGHTVILSSHLVDEVERIATVVGVLDRGALRFEGAPAALLDEMREVELAGSPVPEGFSVVARIGKSGRSMLRAPVDRWQAAGFAPGAVHRTSLEEAFLALVSRSVGHDPHLRL